MCKGGFANLVKSNSQLIMEIDKYPYLAFQKTINYILFDTSVKNLGREKKMIIETKIKTAINGKLLEYNNSRNAIFAKLLR